MSRSSSIPTQCGRTFGANITNAFRSPTPTPLNSQEFAPLPCLKPVEFGDPHMGAQMLPPPLKRLKTEPQGIEEEVADVSQKIPLNRETGDRRVGGSKAQCLEERPMVDRLVTPSSPHSSRIGFNQEEFKPQIYSPRAMSLITESGAHVTAQKHFMSPVAASVLRRGTAASVYAPQTQASGWRASSRFEWSNESTHLCQSSGVVHRLWQRANAGEGEDDSSSDGLEDVSPILELNQQPSTLLDVSANSSPNKKRGAEVMAQNDWSPFVSKEALELFSNAFNDVYNL
ncbi:unnamed protein product [Phytomonas sp. EM1]|nr:unnamed protein product [Phytomonas sp. EM1]|eukprot:CCW62238.1 unnamed protein product [Phytomonas sp. isolate EM1]